MRALVRHVDQTNQSLARFLDSIRYQDLLQRRPVDHLGPGFADLSRAFDGVRASLHESRAEKEVQARYLGALVEHVPVAMLTLHSDGRLELLNNAARRLLNAAQLPDIDALDAYGHLFRAISPRRGRASAS